LYAANQPKLKILTSRKKKKKKAGRNEEDDKNGERRGTSILGELVQQAALALGKQSI